MDAEAEFYAEYREKLFSYLIRRTGDPDASQDILQESFVRYLDKYRDHGANPALLYTIARNLSVDWRRRLGRVVGGDAEAEADPSPMSPERHLLVREEYRAALAAMAALSDGERDALTLAITGELSYERIAEMAGITVANVKVRVHRARLKLRAALGKEERDGSSHQPVHRR